MLTRRDLTIAVAAVSLTACGFLLADQKPVLSSTIVDWNSVPVKKTDAGSTRQFLRTPTATLNELEVHVTTLEPGKSPHAPHRHGHEELLIIKQGNVEALINGQWKPAGPGSVIFFAANQLHGLRNAGSVPAVYHVVAFKTAATPPDATGVTPVSDSSK